jgi:uroporphyrinogen-III synthase
MATATGSRPVRAHALAGRTIVVTRPERQAGTLAKLILEAGGTPVLFPVIEILDVEDTSPLVALIERLSDFDIAIFISPNAVEKAMNLIASHGGFPSSVRVATVGKGSATLLRRLGIANVIAPSGRFDSEALLELPEMNAVAGSRIVIFRGDGGRDLLGDTLVARGATVEYAECYRRSKPGVDASLLFDLWMREELAGMVITSSEGLRNLLDLVGPTGRSRLKETLLFVPHARVAQTARALGLSQVVLTGPNDDGVVEGMIDWWSEGHASRAPV